MRQTVQVTLVLAALLIGYGGYLTYKENVEKAAYQVGDHTSAALMDATALADAFNARTDPKVAAYLAEVEKSGNLDVDHLGELLKPIAQKAGQLRKLTQVLAALSRNEPITESAAAPIARQPRQASVQPTQAPHLIEEPDSSLRWSQAPPRTKRYTIDASQTSWRRTDAYLPSDVAYRIQVTGRIQARPSDPNLTSPEDAGMVNSDFELLEPSIARFAPLLRLCAGNVCDLADPEGIHCVWENKHYDRLEVWYNDFYKSRSTGERIPFGQSYGLNDGQYGVQVVTDNSGDCALKKTQTDVDRNFPGLVLGRRVK
jgi:hypothetical protein